MTLYLFASRRNLSSVAFTLITLFVIPLSVVVVAHPAARADTVSQKPRAQASSPPHDVNKPLAGERAFFRCLKIPPSRKIKVDLKPQSTLPDLVAWISAMTCQSFIVPAGLRSQTVTFLSPQPISAREAYRAFTSALATMGLSLVPAGRRRWRVVRSDLAARSAVRTFGPKARRLLPRGVEVVTQIWRPRWAHSADLLPVLTRLKGRTGDITIYAPTETLIITDAANNVRRLLTIAETLDQRPAGRAIYLLRPRYAEAEDLAKLLESLEGKGTKRGLRAARAVSSRRRSPQELRRKTAPRFTSKGPRNAPRFVVDSPSNTLIVVADAPAYRRIAALVRSIDVENRGPQIRPWVYRLKHANAENLAKALTAMLSGSSRGGRAGAQGRRGPGRRKNTVSAFEAPVRVQAEKETNTLLILGTARDYLGLRKILRDLDRPRRQVYLQAHIIEANMSDTRDLGVVFHGGGTAGSSTLIGGLTQGAFNSLTLDATALASLSGLAFSLQGPAIPGSAKTFGTKNDISAFGLFIKALATQSSVDLLSSPHVLTLDNQPAEVIVGESIPLRSGITNAASSAAVGGDTAMLAALVQPVQYKEVGVKLKITPTIGEREYLRLKIEQEVSDVSKENFGGLGAAIAKRTIKTTVSLRDGQTVVIGGLVKQRTVVGKTKVPILGDIPILGRLFQSETKSQEKVNLLVVITPHVIRTPSDLRRVLEQKMRERQALLRSISRDGRPALALMTNLDFIYKRGLLSAINQAGAEAKREVALKKAGADTHEARPRELGPLRTGDTGGTARTARTADAPGPRRDRPPVSPSQP